MSSPAKYVIRSKRVAPTLTAESLTDESLFPVFGVAAAQPAAKGLNFKTMLEERIRQDKEDAERSTVLQIATMSTQQLEAAGYAVLPILSRTLGGCTAYNDRLQAREAATAALDPFDVITFLPIIRDDDDDHCTVASETDDEVESIPVEN
jgi:hypothetical protein